MTEPAFPQDSYRSPLAGRYASKAMLELFSERTKIRTWRRLWIHLAEAERELGVEISEAQIEGLRKAADDIDFKRAEAIERETRHDVMAHIRAFGEACPEAAGIIHLGATSCYVGDNTDLVILREGFRLLEKRLVNLIADLARFAGTHRSLPVQAYTHFQPAQLTTVGKRACLWLQDLVLDLDEIERFIEWLPFRGVKGTTGTQASFLELFEGDHDKVKRLDRRVTELMGFSKSFAVTGQTYPRKVDARAVAVLSGVAASAGKFAGDLRLLAHEREMEEPFLKTQVGSSAMAYKRNPMRSERISSLARFVIALVDNPFQTAANQWLERTLDDSAGKRIVISEAFLATDAILGLYHSVARGLVVNPGVIQRNLADELSFMATENILMDAVRAGGNRQELHEKIRALSMEAVRRMKEEGAPSDLLDRLKKDPAFAKLMDDPDKYLDASAFIGRSPEQVGDFLNDVIAPILDARKDLLEDLDDEVRV